MEEGGEEREEEEEEEDKSSREPLSFCVLCVLWVFIILFIEPRRFVIDESIRCRPFVRRFKGRLQALTGPLQGRGPAEFC